jgi:hypothetical protein
MESMPIINPSPLYSVWEDMRRRCRNPKIKYFYRYGGRGIKICREWDDFKTFHDWAIAHGYKKGLNLDRKNNDGDYTPKNCRFVDDVVNSRNRSTTKLTKDMAIEIKRLREGSALTLKQIGAMFGVNDSMVAMIANGRRWKS